MSKYRRAAKVDANQSAIISELRSIPGVTVETGHDDIFIGYKGDNYWIELKNPDTVSIKTGKVRESAIKKSQKKIRESWQGNYHIVTNIDDILIIIGMEEK